jgi:hypothetical protein
VSIPQNWRIHVKTPRLAVIGLAVFASVALALTGCTSSTTPNGGSSASSTPSSAASSSAKDTVAAAVKKLNDTSYKYTIGMSGLTGQGAVDPTAKKASLSWSGKLSGLTVKWDLLQVGSDYWMKLDFGGQNAALGLPSGKWMHIDPSKVKNGADFGIDLTKVDPTRVTGLFDGLTDAKKVDATHYDVTLDLTKSTGGVVSSTDLTKLGDKAKSMPAKVTLDDQGRLAAVALDLSSVDADASINTTYTDYGTPANISAPAASDVVEAPAALYQIFNS